MWNPLYGTRGGVPYGGACLPKDTAAFMQFVREQGWAHEMLAATIRVNDDLRARVPAAPSADKIDDVRAAIQQQDDAGAELMIELGAPQTIVL